jgi:A/G-specific adenine glycosylase
MTAQGKLTLGGARGRERFRRSLLAWYDAHRRDLPWRQDRDPYRVWLSEIMLQQTRVAAVVEHYREFLERFPTIEKLAAARETSVLAAWSGLGYYRRARMLHAAAKEIVSEHAGKFPPTAAELCQLPGIGRYTAAAIASIAFGEPVAVVDGNVTRVLERLLDQPMASAGRWQAAGELLAAQRPGDFNQAMMELGATVCLARQPRCLVCPVFRSCATQGDGEKRRPKLRQKKREIHYALDCRQGSVFLIERSAEAALMPGMWELPEISNQDDPAGVWLTLRHSITTTDYLVRVRHAPACPGTKGRWVLKRRVWSLPLTGLARKILRAAGWEE